MRSFSPSSRWFFRLCCGVILFLSAAASASGYLERWPFWTGDIAEGSNEPYEVLMLSGSAPKPYVYRHLLPDIANFAARVTPRNVQDSLYELVFPSDKSRGPAKFRLLTETSEDVRKKWFFPALILYLLIFVSAMCAVISMWLMCEALKLPSPVNVLTSMITILLAPYFYIYPYDFSELAFLTAATWVALSFDWRWLVPIAVLGAWNKESFLFFIPTLYPFLRRRMSAPKASVAVSMLIFLCGLVYLYTRARFANNPGTFVEFGLADRISSFFDPFLLFKATDEVYGLRLVRVSTLLPTLVLIWVLVRGWKRFPEVVRKHCVIAAAINIPLYALFCSPNEYRNFSLLSVAFILAIAFNMKEWLDR